MKKITIILGIILSIFIGIVLLVPLNYQIENLSFTTTTINYYKDNTININSNTQHNGLITNKNNLYMWGENSFGQLGDETEINKDIPTLIYLNLNENFLNLSLGNSVTGLITEEGNLYMWGYNNYGQLGDGTEVDKFTPTLITIPNNDTSKHLKFGGQFFTGLITEEGNLYMWGRNYHGQLGDGTEIDKFTPTLITIPNGETPKQLSLGHTHSGLITEEGNLYMWGGNQYGQLGDGTTDNRNTPTVITIPNNDTPKQLSLGENFTGLITEEGNLYMWGYADYIDDSGTFSYYNPTLINIPNNEIPINISLGRNFTGIVTNENNLYMWGDNSYGQLGDGTEIQKDLPTLINVPNNDVIHTLLTGYNYTTIITHQNNIYTWGANNHGQLGDGTNDNKNTPSLIFNSAFNDELILLIDYSETITIENEASYVKFLPLIPLILVATFIIIAISYEKQN